MTNAEPGIAGFFKIAADAARVILGDVVANMSDEEVLDFYSAWFTATKVQKAN
jgi:hypothetical protein